MASPYNVIFPPRGRIGLDGGLNTNTEPAWLLDNESPSCMNVIFGDGSVETRGGTTQLNTAAVGSFACDGLFTRHDSSGAETMVGWWDGTFYDLQGTSFLSITSSKSVFTAGVKVSSTEYENYIFFANGEDIPRKWNGAEFTRMGIYPPSTAFTAATAATGSALSGTYSYKMTWVNSNLVESDVGPVSNTLTAANENIALTSLPVAPISFGVNTRRLYRTEDSGTTYKRLATISDNTTTTYEDAIDDSDLGVDAPTDNGYPPVTATSLLFHQGRIFMIDTADNLVKYSEVGNPYVVKATNFLRIGDTSGDIPRVLSIHDNSILVSCKRSNWIIYMPDTDDSNWIQLRIKTAYGSRSPFGAFNFNDSVMIPATENDIFVGFAAITGQTVEPSVTLMTISATGSYLHSDKIEPDLLDVVSSQVPSIVSIVYQNKAYIALTKTTGSINNRIYVFDFSIEGLSKKQKYSWAPWSGLSVADFTIYNNTLYYADDNATGLVFEMNTTSYNDNGSAINSYFYTKEFGGRPGDENFTKDFRWLHLFYKLAGEWYLTINRLLDSDSEDGPGSQLWLSDDSQSIWDTSVWDFDVWSSAKTNRDTKIPLGGLRGKRIQFKFSNGNVADQYFKIVGLNLEYNLRGRR